MNTKDNSKVVAWLTLMVNLCGSLIKLTSASLVLLVIVILTRMVDHVIPALIIATVLISLWSAL